MATGLQAKILRVIQERKVRRLGSLHENNIDLKIISSVNREPHVAIAENALRPDLFYRLGVVFIPIPPLRDRKEDIVLLARHFLAKHRRVLNKKVTDISSDVLSLFNNYDWPGNARELEHVIEGAINLVTSSRTIERRHLQSHLTTWKRLRGLPDAEFSLKAGVSFQGYRGENHQNIGRPVSSQGAGQLMMNNGKGLLETQAGHEKNVVKDALARHAGNITRAAKSVGISRQLFNYKMKKYNIDRRDYLT